MSKMNPQKARVRLQKACERYIHHKKGWLDGLMATRRWQPADFGEALNGRDDPNPGFSDWVRCKYYDIFDSIFFIVRGRDVGDYGSVRNYFSQMNFSRIPERGLLKCYRPQDESLDQHDPKLVLHNLNALIWILNTILEHDQKLQFTALKAQSDYREEDYAYPEDTPYSLKIERTLRHFVAFTDFVATLPGYQHKLDPPGPYIKEAYPTFEGYLKWIAVKELKELLDDSSLTDQEAVEQVKLRLKETPTLELLEKNHQSASEQRLKLLSVISIIFGIGIFSTLGLMVKRLFNSGGSSINFFKPLSVNLREDIEQIVAHTHQGT